MLGCELRGPSAMVEDERGDNLGDGKNSLKDQKRLDNCAQGFEIGRLSNLMGSEVAHTSELEDLYYKMLAKIEGLSKSVEQTNAKVLEQENHNMRLRYRVAGLE
ncbi:hypothetical protein PHJA_001762000 [Phtheirospermum japonicum]|uniref:Uncharacterized protein n=1 Tax=Phtheirospermum japonicum TaxID=374723 RepID=A0A830CA89_9LAMI|nr:hypothetical protein PHJA_001762000 [Phtheirospermum japonicum]